MGNIRSLVTACSPLKKGSGYFASRQLEAVSGCA